MSLSVTTSVQYLKGIGPKRAKLLNKLGIHTIEDLFYYFPRRYEDRTNFIPISKLEVGQMYAIKAKILAKAQRQSFRRRGFTIIEIAVGDETGKLFCVWFNQPYLKDYFKLQETLILYGKVERFVGRLQMNSPEFELVSGDEDESLNIARIVPIYSLPQGLTQRHFRKTMKYVLDEYVPRLNDCLPYDIRSRNRLLNLPQSLLNIHFPDNSTLQKQAYERLSFEEFFLFQLPLALRKLNREKKKGIAHKVEGDLSRNFIESLDFKLTKAQEKVLSELKYDMASTNPMQRLLQGDVGSGKTVIATIASIFAIQGGYQVAFMVPTELLARQHFENIKCQSVKVLRCQEKEIKIGLLISSLNKKEKEKIYQDIKEGKIDLVIGTHALLEEKVQFKNLGLVVVDEQHKFGVAQRTLLPQKGINPDILIMTATPIPRTLAITIYGDLDISVINELPAGRLPVKTMHFSQGQGGQAYELVKEELSLGHQAYIIHPVIEESYELDLAGVKKAYVELKKNEFCAFRLGLIHGRLKQKEQDEIMLKFKNKELDILVATTVLEVGIDIPNATCMVIEQAQRFGLAQLHQLRGRVGRGSYKSFCILISDASTEEAKLRIQAMLKYGDGFRIAEEDLKIRGPGEFFGQRQSGLSELKIANPLTQLQLLKRAREEAIRLTNTDPHLEAWQNRGLKQKLLQRFPEYEKLVVAG